MDKKKLQPAWRGIFHRANMIDSHTFSQQLNSQEKVSQRKKITLADSRLVKKNNTMQ